ncbi:MAG: helix-turn-helix transcriptional regulator [bacterium]|nr:helix-turn-helix transcriptional regulator [bacterium]
MVVVDITKRFGNRVKELRLKKKLSQAALADRLGLHSTYISQVERGVRNMALKNIEKLAKALKVKVEDLVK